MSIFRTALQAMGLGTSPSAPPAGQYKLYFKNDGKLYTQNSAGAEAAVGGDLRASLGVVSETITDWNNATSNGWVMAFNAPNAPDAGWWKGYVSVHNDGWIEQVAHAFVDYNYRIGLFGQTRKRVKADGSWGPWFEVQPTLAQTDSRYWRKDVDLRLSGSNSTHVLSSCNNAKESGFYYVYNADAAAGAIPSGWGNEVELVVSGYDGSGYTSQIAIHTRESRIATRTLYEGNTWTGWKELGTTRFGTTTWWIVGGTTVNNSDIFFSDGSAPRVGDLLVCTNGYGPGELYAVDAILSSTQVQIGYRGNLRGPTGATGPSGSMLWKARDETIGFGGMAAQANGATGTTGAVSPSVSRPSATHCQVVLTSGANARNNVNQAVDWYIEASVAGGAWTTIAHTYMHNNSGTSPQLGAFLVGWVTFTAGAALSFRVKVANGGGGPVLDLGLVSLQYNFF